MKKYLKYFVAAAMSIAAVFSQIAEVSTEFKFGEHNALQLNLIDVRKNLVEDVWKDINKQFGKTDKKKGEFITKDVNLVGLSNPVDWFMKLDKSKSAVVLYLCVISDEEFLSSSNQPDNYTVITDFLNKFAYKVEKARVKEEFKSETKELVKLQKNLGR